MAGFGDGRGSDTAALIISDRGAESMFTKAEGKAAIRPDASKVAGHLFVGKSHDKASVVMLQDASGKPRLMLKVTPDGDAAIDFLNDKGEVVKTIGPEG